MQGCEGEDTFDSLFGCNGLTPPRISTQRGIAPISSCWFLIQGRGWDSTLPAGLNPSNPPPTCSTGFPEAGWGGTPTGVCGPPWLQGCVGHVTPQDIETRGQRNDAAKVNARSMQPPFNKDQPWNIGGPFLSAALGSDCCLATDRVWSACFLRINFLGGLLLDRIFGSGFGLLFGHELNINTGSLCLGEGGSLTGHYLADAKQIASKQDTDSQRRRACVLG